MNKRAAALDVDDHDGEPVSDLRMIGYFDSPDVGRIAEVDGEFLRSRRHRIAQRAYFLWENRSGERWWDAVSNWLQAEQIESASVS